MMAIFGNRSITIGRLLASSSAPIFLLVISSFFGQNVSAQYRIDSWNADNGLPQNPVNKVLQSRDGFIWLATFSGLVRYDGATFQIFNTVNTSGMKSSRFTGLFEDDDGNLWAPTEGQGLTLYREHTFTTFTTENGLPDNSINGIFYDHQGNLLFDTYKGVAQWKGNRIVNYSGDVPSESRGIRRIIFRGRGNVTWYLGNDGALYKFENGGVVKRLETEFNVIRVFEDRQARLWMEIEENTLRR